MNCCHFFSYLLPSLPSQPPSSPQKGLHINDSSSEERKSPPPNSPHSAQISRITTENPLRKGFNAEKAYCKTFSATAAIARKFFEKASFSPPEFQALLAFMSNEGRYYQSQAKQTGLAIYLSPKSLSTLPRAVQFNPDADILMHFSKLKKGDELIGQGAFKKVKLSWSFKKGLLVKHSCQVDPPLFVLSVLQQENIDNEKKMAQLLNAHPHICILDLKSVTEVPKDDGSVKWRWTTPFFNGGDLFDALESKNPPFLIKKEKLIIAKQLLETLQWLHEEKKIIHRDIKLENILIEKNSDKSLKKAAISDWGAAALIGDREALQRKRGTPAYMAPEIWSVCFSNSSKDVAAVFTPLSDCWALGLVLYALFKKEVPEWKRVRTIIDYPNEQSDEYFIYHHYCRLPENWLPLPRVSEPIHEVIIGLLAVDPTKRLTAKEAIKRLGSA